MLRRRTKFSLLAVLSVVAFSYCVFGYLTVGFVAGGSAHPERFARSAIGWIVAAAIAFVFEIVFAFVAVRSSRM
jgi:hypothetical protein